MEFIYPGIEDYVDIARCRDSEKTWEGVGGGGGGGGDVSLVVLL